MNQLEPSKDSGEDKEILPFPLYHGTSSLFLDSILKTGLGAINIHEKFSLQKLAAELLIASESYKDDEKWKFTRHLCTRMAEKPTEEYESRTPGFSYGYGGAFVTPSRQTAIRYATRNPFGSEAKGIVDDMIFLFKETAPAALGAEHTGFLASLVNHPTFPVLIELHGVSTTNLRAEQGGNPRHTLAQLQQWFEKEDADVFELLTQQSNFELLSPVSPAHLRAFRVDPAANDYPHHKSGKLTRLH